MSSDGLVEPSGRSSEARLWQALATRLNEVVPSGFRVRYRDGGHLVIEAPDGLGSAAFVGKAESADASLERLEWAAGPVRRLLSDVQDVVSETTRDPWPRMPGAKRVEAPAGARVANGVLHCWYGDEQAPVIALRQLALTGGRADVVSPDDEL